MSTTLARVLSAGLAGEGRFSSRLAHPLFLGWALRGLEGWSTVLSRLEEGVSVSREIELVMEDYVILD